MKFLRRLVGLHFPDPVVGQVWRSRHNGRCIRVSDVEVTDTGATVVSVKVERHGEPSPMGMEYAFSLGHWRRRLREEARELMGGSAIEPWHPWPRR